MTSAIIQPRADVQAIVAQTVAGLAQPGSFFTGAERVALAETARLALGRGLQLDSIPEPFDEATRLVSADAASIRRELVEHWAIADLDRLSYVELVSVVARLSAADAYNYGLGLALIDLPAKASSQPSSVDAHPEAAIHNSWVPTVGSASAVNALSAVPAEASAVREMHTFLYLPYEHVGDLSKSGSGPLTRPQMELVAARTSYLNECFY